MLAPTLHGASLAVLPDYAAAWSVAPLGTDIVVIAGTGSVIVSRTDEYVVTGGAGLAGGDPGSALRLGHVALAHVGVDCGRLPAVEVARRAIDLTGAAAVGEPWAIEALRAEIGELAEDVRLHSARVGRTRSRSKVAVTGGVFSSPAAIAELTAALGASFDVVRIEAEPVLGAVRIARELAA